jgi:hypothetical protein
VGWCGERGRAAWSGGSICCVQRVSCVLSTRCPNTRREFNVPCARHKYVLLKLKDVSTTSSIEVNWEGVNHYAMKVYGGVDV